MSRALLPYINLRTWSNCPRFASSLFRAEFPSKFPKSSIQGVRCCSAVPSTSPETASRLPAKKRVVSGVQPTGSLHLGNYLGAIKNWVALQEAYETLFFIVDLHAITLPHDPKELLKATRDTAAVYLACGIDPSKAAIFVQSHVHAHVELMWLLSSATPIGRLERMIQFKEKSKKAGDESVGAGLLTYPVLMAADILLYQNDCILADGPVSAAGGPAILPNVVKAVEIARQRGILIVWASFSNPGDGFSSIDDVYTFNLQEPNLDDDEPSV